MFMAVGWWNAKCFDARAPFLGLVPRTSVSLCAVNSVFVTQRTVGYVWVGLWVVEVVTLDCELLQNVRTSYPVGAGVKRLGLATLLRVVKVAIPLQAWSGPEGSRKLRFPDFMTTTQDGGKVVSLTHWPPLPQGNTPGTHFC